MSGGVLIDVAVEEVIVSDRLRDVNVGVVRHMAMSMAEIGPITPIEVMRRQDGTFRLVAGAHRLAAAKEAGISHLKAIIFEGDDVSARLREIDENLHRAELTPYDQASFLNARFNLWRSLNDVVEWGGDRRSVDWRASNGHAGHLGKKADRQAFYEHTAATVGLAPRTIRRAIKRRNELAPFWADLRNTEASSNGALLDALVKLKDPYRQDVMDLVLGGTPVGEAVERAGPPKSHASKPQKSPSLMMKEVRRLWALLPAKHRRILRDEINNAEGDIDET